MRFEGILRFLFIQYCVAAGLLLVIAPWSLLWERFLLLLPHGLPSFFFGHSAARGGISGFGLVHFMWAFHDLSSLLIPKRAHGGDEGSS